MGGHLDYDYVKLSWRRYCFISFLLLKIRDYEMLPNFLGGNQIDAKMYGQFCGISLIHSALFGLQLPLQLYTLFAEFPG